MNTSTSRADGFLGWIERSGNKLPDPVFIFVYCILGVIAASVIATFFWRLCCPSRVSRRRRQRTDY